MLYLPQKFAVDTTKITNVFLGIVLLFLCSQAYIPLQPVPITLQTVGVMIVAFSFKKKEALSSVFSYIMLGIVGFPVFGEYTGGINIVLGASGGYILGFLPAVYMVSLLRETYGDHSWSKIVLYNIVGTIVIFMVGLPWLSHFVGFSKAIEFGLIPFILPGILKAVATSFIIKIVKGKNYYI